MWTARAYEPVDRPQLASFRCAGPHYAKYTKRVQSLVRHQLADALEDDSRRVEARVAILTSDHTTLIGVVAYEPAQDDPAVWAILALGVASNYRRNGVGRGLFTVALERLVDAGAVHAEHRAVDVFPPESAHLTAA